MEDPHRDIPLLHASDHAPCGLLVIERLKAGGQPETEAPGRRQRRAPSQSRISFQDIRRPPPIYQMIAELLARYSQTHKLHLLGPHLEGNGSGMVRIHAVAFAGHIEGDILVAHIAGGPAVLIPHGDRLAVLNERREPLAETIDGLPRLHGELRAHIRFVISRQVTAVRPVGGRLLIDPHVGQVPETAGGQDPPLRLEGHEPAVPLHAYKHVAGRHDGFLFIHPDLDRVRGQGEGYARFLLVEARKVSHGHSDIIVPCGNEINREHRQVQRLRPGPDRPLRRCDPHAAGNLFDSKSLRSVGGLNALPPQPIPFRKSHGCTPS